MNVALRVKGGLKREGVRRGNERSEAGERVTSGTNRVDFGNHIVLM